MPSPTSATITRVRVAVPFVLAGLVSVVAALGPGGVGCTIHEVSGGTSGGGTFDERPVLRHQAEAVALPAFRAAATEAAALMVATAELEAAPSASTVAAAQSAWRRARAAWTRTAVFGFGPAKDLTPRIEWFPTETTKVEAQVAGEEPIDDAAIARLGANERGLGALEVLLFAAGDGDDVAQVLTAIDTAPRRAALARALAVDVAAAITAIQTAWEQSDGAYAEQLATAGEGSTAFPARKDGTDAIVNESIFVLELVLGDELALPLGLRDDGTPQPEQVRSQWSDASIDDALGHLDAFGAAYFGAAGEGGVPIDAAGGLADLVRARGGDDLDQDVRDAFALSRGAVAFIPGPLRTAITTDPAKVQRAYDEVRELKRLLASDVATAVGTTLSFNDNDGD